MHDNTTITGQAGVSLIMATESSAKMRRTAKPAKIPRDRPCSPSLPAVGSGSISRPERLKLQKLSVFLPRNGHRRLGGDEPATVSEERRAGELNRIFVVRRPRRSTPYRITGLSVLSSPMLVLSSNLLPHGPVLTPILSSSSSWMMMRGVTIIIRLEVSRPIPTFLNSRSR